MFVLTIVQWIRYIIINSVACFKSYEIRRVPPSVILQVEHFLQHEAKGTKVIGATSLPDMVSKLKTPRKVMMLVKGKRKQTNAIPYKHTYVHRLG